MKKEILSCFVVLMVSVYEVSAQGGEYMDHSYQGTIVVKEHDYRPYNIGGPAKSPSIVNDGYDQLLKNKTLLSPQAEAIEKYNCYSVDYSTGVPNISIPLYEIKVGNFTLPVTINYHASGIKVQDIATPIGLGWTLNAGGIVTRQVRGTEDEILNGMLSLEYTSESEIDYDMAYATNISNYHWQRLAAKGEGDTESDRYTYSINGKGGVFRYCVTDNSLRAIPYSGIKIENISSGGYVIIDTDGTKYYFQEGETNTDHSSSTLSAITTWYISKIEPSSSKNIIEFTYVSGKAYTMDYISQIDNKGVAYEMVYHDYPYDWYDLERNQFFSEMYNAYCGTFHGTKLLSQITWAGNTITLNYQQDRKELNLNLDRLQGIVVKNSSNNVIRSINFDNNNYMGSTKNDYRMMLNGITIQGSSSTDAVSYEFGYNSTPLPDYFIVGTDINCHEDYWGYYNGSNTSSWIPSSEYSTSNGSTNNRTPNGYRMKAGTLESIKYPTGGKTVLTMEANVTDDGRAWGGLRVSMLTDKDADGTVITTKTYQYEHADVAQETSADMFSYDVNYYYGYKDTRDLQWNVGNHTIKTSSPILPLTANTGSPIYYGKVTEFINGLGKTEYYYKQNIASLNNIDDNGHSNDPLRLYSTLYNYDRGNVVPILYSKKVYALDGSTYRLKCAEGYNYTEINRDTFRLGVRFEQENVLINYGGISVYDGTFDNSQFHYTFCYSDVWAVPSFFVLSSKSVTDYDGKVTVTTSYGYDSQYRTLKPTSETTTVSNGDALTTHYTYPFQKAGTVYSAMTNANIQVPVETRISRGGTVITNNLTSYANYGGLYLPSAYYLGKGSATPELRVQYDYDTYGNLAYAIKDGTEKTVLLWGYKGLHPVARIEGMTKSAVYSALGSTVNTLLANPTDANIYAVNSNSTIANSGLATTYTWKPLTGITSIRKPNLETTYYTYDTMGRLSNAKNNSSNTIENYVYNIGGSNAANYVLTRTMRNSSGSAYRDTYNFYDGLGRKTETVAKAQSPNGSNLVTMTEYDALDRVVKNWLATTFSASGSFVAASTFRSASRPYYDNDTKPFSLTEYESCHSDKVTKEYGPGAAWQNNEKGIGYVYTGNSANDVRIYVASNDDSSLTGNGTYNANQLFSVRIQNEDGNYSYKFTDKEGRLVLERQTVGSAKYDTYYVYDIYGNLAFVLPPAASDALTLGTWSINSNTTLQNYAYNYKYDSRNRCVEKKLPGCEKISVTYDTADRIIATQDGVQRLTGASTYYEYDSFSRQIVKGTKTSAGVKTPLLQNYYDTYAFFSELGSGASNYAFSSSGGSDSNYSNSRGMLTGSKVSLLNNPSTYLYTALHYGERGRLVQQHRDNHLGGIDHEYYTYNFTGTVATRKLVHTASGKATQTEIYTNTYDIADRLTNVTHKLNSNSAVTLTVNSYDAVGRLITSKPLNNETVTYAYNVRNWLKGIGSTHFTEQLAYNTANGSLTPSAAKWGGNVSAMSWKAGNEANMRSYQFSYNELDWLTGAEYNGTGYYRTEYTYDKMGNITTMKRNGLQDGGTYGLIDNLNFSYTGNHMTKVEDSASDPTYSGAFSFMDGASQSNEYTYDGNGNMTKDLNKNISSIQYNLLNLPQKVTFKNGNTVSYTYDATGRKTGASYGFVTTGVTYAYCDNFHYENGTLKEILIDGGYITFNGSTPVYHYYLRDHLGNNRVVMNKTGAVEQVNHYYPYGGLFGESTGNDAQRYKYNGKEFDRMHGLDWLDYGARYMSPDVARFTTMDPMAEKYYHLSPYAYCGNDPINAFDEKGDSIFVLNAPKGANGLGHLGILIQNQDLKWVYYSKNGTNSSSGLYGEAKGDNKGDVSFTSIEEFLGNSQYNPIDEATGERKYSEGFLIPSTPDEDIKAKEAALGELSKNYNVLGSNCAVTVQKSLKAAGKESGAPHNLRFAFTPYKTLSVIDFYIRSKVPNIIYNQIKTQNTGFVIKAK